MERIKIGDIVYYETGSKRGRCLVVGLTGYTVQIKGIDNEYLFSVSAIDENGVTHKNTNTCSIYYVKKYYPPIIPHKKLSKHTMI